MFYAQLDQNNICVGISQLSGQVPEYNYHTPTTFDPITGQTTEGESVFLSRMIQICTYSSSYMGLRYMENGNWEEVESIE